MSRTLIGIVLMVCIVVLAAPAMAESEASISGPDQVAAGDTVTYTFSITNTGESAAPYALDVSVPEEWEIVDRTDGESVDTRGTTWTYQPIDPGTTTEVSITVSIPEDTTAESVEIDSSVTRGDQQEPTSQTMTVAVGTEAGSSSSGSTTVGIGVAALLVIVVGVGVVFHQRGGGFDELQTNVAALSVRAREELTSAHSTETEQSTADSATASSSSTNGSVSPVTESESTESTSADSATKANESTSANAQPVAAYRKRLTDAGVYVRYLAPGEDNLRLAYSIDHTEYEAITDEIETIANLYVAEIGIEHETSGLDVRILEGDEPLAAWRIEDEWATAVARGEQTETAFEQTVVQTLKLQ